MLSYKIAAAQKFNYYFMSSSKILLKSLPFFLMGMFFYMPEALAAPVISFKPTPDLQYKVYEGEDYVVSVDLSGFAFLTKIDLYLKGPLDSSSASEKLINSYEYSKNGVHEFIWNGKLDGQYAPPGRYRILLKGSDICLYEANILSHEFEVTSDALIQNTQTPVSVTPDSEKFEIKTNLQTAEASCIELRIDGQTVKNYKNLLTGDQTLSWDLLIDGKNLDAGDHTWELVSNGLACGGTDEDEKLLQSGKFKMTVATKETYASLCADFTDIDPNSPDCEAIGYVKSIGAITGFPDGTFRPDSILLRDQMAKISLETFKLFSQGTDYCLGEAAFPDVPQSQWSYQYVCRGAQLGMITGYEGGEDQGNYIPDRPVNRVEFLALISRNLEDTMPNLNTPSYQDVPMGQWYTGFAAYSFNNLLFPGANLTPAKEVSRVEVARILYRLFQLGKL